MGTAGDAMREIVALGRAAERRVRMEQTLRATLGQLEAQHVVLVERVDVATRGARVIEDELKRYRHRAAGMTSGNEPFSIESLTAIRRHAEALDIQLADAHKALAAAQKLVRDMDTEIAGMRHRIAQNRRRIDVCEERILMVKRRRDVIAADAEDEETEEMIIARLAS